MSACYKFTVEKRDAYVGCIRSGMRRGEASRAIGISRQIVAAYQREHPEFASAVAQAEIDACDPVEAALFNKALDGNLGAMVFWLTNRNPDRWRDRRGSVITIQQQPLFSEADRQSLRNAYGFHTPRSSNASLSDVSTNGTS